MGNDDQLSQAVALAMQRVADAQRALVELTISGAKTIAERQQQLADLLKNGAPAVSRDPAADTLIVDVDWDTRAVTLTQTTGNVLRVAVNGAWAEVPDRARISLGFNDVARPLAVPISSAHLVLPHSTRSGPYDPRPGEVVVRLVKPGTGGVLLLAPGVELVDAWHEGDPPMVALQVRGDIDAVRALFPGASEFAGPRESL